MQKITPCLWFDTEAEQAAKFYTSVFPNSKSQRVVSAMLQMGKIEIDGLRAAHEGAAIPG